MTVTNPYYEFTPAFVPGATVRADEVNTQYQAIQNAFDFLPGESDALTTGTATFAPESGSGNAFVVTMSDTRLSNQDGDEIIFYASHGNTGAATLNVDSIGAIALVDRTGAALISGDIVSGRLYTATYDATNTQFVLDTTVNIVTNIVDVVQGTSVDNPAIPGGTWNAFLAYENANGDQLAIAGYDNTVGGDFLIDNKIRSGNVLINGRTSAGALVGFVDCDPDGSVEFDFPGAGGVTRTVASASGGLEVKGLTASYERVLTLRDASETSTTAALAAIGDAINTSDEKEAGFSVFNTTTGLPVWALGNTDGAVWVDATGATAHTPV